MPAADPELAAELAKTTLQIYSEAVERLLSIVARRLAAGVDQPGWAEAKLAEQVALRNQAQAVVTQLAADTPAVIEAALTDAYTKGAAEIGTGFATTNQRGLDALVRETVSAVESTHFRILRSVGDIYRQTITETALPGVLTGTTTTRQAAQAALNRFANQGITGFTDRAGRNWQLDSYVEMATRTGAGRAQVAGGLDRLVDQGKDLVIVSNAPQECSKCRPWEGRILSISGDRVGERVDGKRVVASVADARAAGLLHANCFPGDVRVSGPAVRAADTRWYEGQLVVIHTARGDELPVTPNHPVLTSEGWVAAGALDVGDQLVRHLGAERMGLVGPDDEQVPARIGEVPGALRESLSMVAVRVPATAEQFHGDGAGTHGDVDVVATNRPLRPRQVASPSQPVREHAFLGRGMGLGPVLAERPPLEVLVGAHHAPDGLMGVGHLGGSLLCRHGRPLPGLGLAPGDLRSVLEDPAGHRTLGDAEIVGDVLLALTSAVASDDLLDVGGLFSLAGGNRAGLGAGAHHARGPDPLIDVGDADADGGRNLAARLSGEVALDDVVHVDRRHFAGHVFNLQTVGGWYTANGIVVHNCRHALGAYIEGLTKPMTHTADPEGDQLRQEQRRLERGVRQWKRREAVAMSDQERATAQAKVREWQAALKAHVDGNGLKRLRYRESA